MMSGFSKTLNKNKKKPWPTLPLTIGAYTVKEFKEVEAEVEDIKGSHFLTFAHRSYDLERIVPTHYKQAKFNWNYQHI